MVCTVNILPEDYENYLQTVNRYNEMGDAAKGKGGGERKGGRARPPTIQPPADLLEGAIPPAGSATQAVAASNPQSVTVEEDSEHASRGGAPPSTRTGGAGRQK